ncbi:hypothetical protein TNCV_2472751 [Trichonephila clavipes]|nr:hypothetical protein TNCV_2472751 [Trichonephila clavipes]
MRQLIAVTPDSADRKPVETGSYTRWYNQTDGSVHRGTDPRNRFQSRGNHGQPHQSHMGDSVEGNSSTVNLGSLYNRIDLIFTRPETKITRGKDDN